MRNHHAHETRNRSMTFVAIAIAVFFVISPCVYTLSIGPAAWMCSNGYVDDDLVRPFYFPLIWLHDSTGLEKPLEWYVDLWE